MIKRWFFFTLMKLGLEVLFTDLSQHFGIYLVVFTLKFSIYWHEVSGNLNSFVL